MEWSESEQRRELLVEEGSDRSIFRGSESWRREPTTAGAPLMRAEGLDDVLVTVGGTIPAQDISTLKTLGVAAVFTPGTSTSGAIALIREAVRR